jgi:biotin-(acetyl-CoA carboxylase) ligase
LETGVDYNLELLLVLVVERVKHYLGDSPMNNFKSIKQKYEEAMFRWGQSADFALADGPRFRGTIVGITDTGLLAMEKEDGKLVNFNFKEVKYLL